ncbi:MAG: hypothetical protein V1798_08405 [Pseudomonadota bacterium]
MIAKGLLRAEDIPPLPNAKFNVRDVLWVAEHVEPRVLEVFPAAYLHFPRAFLRHKDLPPDLVRIIQTVKRQQPNVADYRGIRVRDMIRWANRVLPDRRTRPTRAIRRNKTLRLRPEVIAHLSSLAVRTGKTETRVVEELILGES